MSEYDEKPVAEPEIRGGDSPVDYIAEAPLPRPPRNLRADAGDAEEDLDDDES